MSLEYLPIGLMILVAVGFAAATILFSIFTSQKARTNPAKDSAYECGLPALTGPHLRFSVKFYLVAMLFILFDIEVVFLYPWAVVYKALGFPGLVEAGAFLGILMVGFIYAWDNGALDWK